LTPTNSLSIASPNTLIKHLCLFVRGVVCVSFLEEGSIFSCIVVFLAFHCSIAFLGGFSHTCTTLHHVS
jgi:hypothetical protein